MSRTLSSALATHVAGHSHTRCKMLKLVLTDGTVIGVTDHDRDLTYNLGDGAVTYDSGTGVLASDIAMSASLDADNYEVSGPVNGTFTLAGLLGGRFDNARAYLFEVNWKSLGDGAAKFLAGNVREIRVEGGTFKFEIRSDMDRFNQVVGRVLANNCDADFGDVRCGATPTVESETVVAVTDSMRFTVTNGGSHADDFFNLGIVTPTSGANDGQAPIEIVNWEDNGDGTASLELFTPLVSTPAVGDGFDIQNGCSKARKSDTVGVPTCLGYNNVINFRGFPEIPGSDQVFRAAVPGEGDQ